MRICSGSHSTPHPLPHHLGAYALTTEADKFAVPKDFTTSLDDGMKRLNTRETVLGLLAATSRGVDVRSGSVTAVTDAIVKEAAGDSSMAFSLAGEAGTVIGLCAVTGASPTATDVNGMPTGVADKLKLVSGSSAKAFASTSHAGSAGYY